MSDFRREIDEQIEHACKTITGLIDIMFCEVCVHAGLLKNHDPYKLADLITKDKIVKISSFINKETFFESYYVYIHDELYAIILNQKFNPNNDSFETASRDVVDLEFIVNYQIIYVNEIEKHPGTDLLELYRKSKEGFKMNNDAVNMIVSDLGYTLTDPQVKGHITYTKSLTKNKVRLIDIDINNNKIYAWHKTLLGDSRCVKLTKKEKEVFEFILYDANGGYEDDMY